MIGIWRIGMPIIMPENRHSAVPISSRQTKSANGTAFDVVVKPYRDLNNGNTAALDRYRVASRLVSQWFCAGLGGAGSICCCSSLSLPR
jgi:hypothetical protein